MSDAAVQAVGQASGTTYWLTRFYFQRSLAFIYAMGFLIALNQFRALCGDHGILPMRLFLKRSNFWESPSLFWINHSNQFVMILAALGLILAVIAMLGISDNYGTFVSAAVWCSLWILYLSFVNVGQTFYGFGWEVLLLEAGFLAIFMGSSKTEPSWITMFLLRWVLFRLMFGAGLIKIRGDECWRDLTCMNYHYETQPMPNPLSWYLHLLPEWINKGAVLFTHFVELVVPFFYFGTRPFRHAAGVITIVFQLMLIFSGNLSWLNYVTIVIAIACFDDSLMAKLPDFFGAWAKKMGVDFASVAKIPEPVYYALAVAVAFLSVNPILNLLSRQQVMNTSFDPLHLVNTYGAFGSVTRTRDEVIFEGADSKEGPWKEYTFKGKPSEVSRIPPVISPYHLRLDWQLWFAAMSSYEYQPWILSFIARLLQGDPLVTSLVRGNPFPNAPPKYIRVSLYEYHFAPRGDKNWWTRSFVSSYLPALSLDDPPFLQILEQQDWL